jgi:hypothetical protein
MERNSPKPWLNKFIIALANSNVEEIGKLQEKIPIFLLRKDAVVARDLIAESISLCKREKKRLLISMGRVQQSKNFVYQDSLKQLGGIKFDSKS